MEALQTWYMSLEGSESFFWTVTLIASFIFAVQTLLTIIGMEHDFDFGDFDVDGHDGTMDTGGAVSLFSIRSMVNFFVGFGWSGVSFLGFLPDWLVYVVSVVIGLGFAYIYVYLRKKMRKLEHNGAFSINDCKDLNAEVYLRIPAERSGIGKVQVSLNGSIHEIDAVTDGEELKSGSRVHIVDIEGNVAVVLDNQMTLV